MSNDLKLCGWQQLLQQGRNLTATEIPTPFLPPQTGRPHVGLCPHQLSPRSTTRLCRQRRPPSGSSSLPTTPKTCPWKLLTSCLSSQQPASGITRCCSCPQHRRLPSSGAKINRSNDSKNLSKQEEEQEAQEQRHLTQLRAVLATLVTQKARGRRGPSPRVPAAPSRSRGGQRGKQSAAQHPCQQLGARGERRN